MLLRQGLAPLPVGLRLSNVGLEVFQFQDVAVGYHGIDCVVGQEEEVVLVGDAPYGSFQAYIQQPYAVNRKIKLVEVHSYTFLCHKDSYYY